MVGYPNVGKSSVINAVLGKKKVAVASMPGKTKHFQTLMLTDKVTLCDCPGLVFPRISSSYAEMVLNGLYSIDTLKSFNDPM
jgi:large subunit GTPase 1